jgi:hypothetical protein
VTETTLRRSDASLEEIRKRLGAMEELKTKIDRLRRKTVHGNGLDPVVPLLAICD